MCGRYSLTAPEPVLRRRFGITAAPSFPHAARYNIAPGQEVPVVAERRSRHLVAMHWGMTPPWLREGGKPLINARSETAATKPAFRQALLLHRCLLPADGFYEWGQSGARRQPFRFVLPADGLFALAGIWAAETDPQGRRVLSCAILTREATGAEREIHSRMPVILPREREAEWLDPGLRDPVRIGELLACPPLPLQVYPVSPWVNSPRHEGPQCIAPLEADGET